jgi:photosystem II stability/assembly factor-like uncharacterized protein
MKHSRAALIPLALLAVAALVMAVTPAPRGSLRSAPRVVLETKDGDEHGAVRAPNPWFYLERAFPIGMIPRDAWRDAQTQAREMRSAAGSRSSFWEFRGPTNVGGRITDLAVDPLDPAVCFAGAAEGGVLRTTDSGQHWTPLFDDQSTLSIGAVALDPSNPQTVYVGTGEVNPGGGSVAYGGTGVYKSTDRGDTWTSIGLDGTGSIGRIRIDPTDPQRIFVAAMGDLWTAGAARGVYRSTDGGAHWQRVLALSDSTGAVDLVIRPDQPQTIFASMWERIRRIRYYRYGGPTCGLYKSTDGGTTWALVGGGLPTPSATSGRIGISLCAAAPDNMYAVYADKTGYYAGTYKSTNGGASWARTSDGALANVFSSYGWWFGNLRVHPTDPTRVWVLGLDFYRSTNGGSSWSEVSGGMHVDHHALEFGPGANPVIYEGNDGGLYRSTNGGSAWTMLPNQPITQFYRVCLDASRPNALYGGAQDNGTVRTLTGALDDYANIYGGDGFQPLVHPTNPSKIWALYQYCGLGYSSNGGSSFVDATSGISASDRRNWNTAIRFNATNPNTMYCGTQKVYRSTNGTSWTAISPDLTGGAGGGSQGNVYGTITTIDSSPIDGLVIWAGSDDGHVNVTTNGGTNWTDVSAALPDRWITSVRTSPQTREVAYVTLSGFRWGSPLPHVFRTTDLGATWAPIASNLPEAPANDIVIDPTNANRLFVATDVGVFETCNGGGSWAMLGSNLPNVVIDQLVFDPASRKLTAATYGRSFFSYAIDQVSEVVQSEPLAAGVVDVRPNPSRGETTIRWRRSDATGPVTVEIFTVDGRRVFAGTVAGKDEIRWTPESGSRGVYYVRVSSREGRIGQGSIVVSS